MLCPSVRAIARSLSRSALAVAAIVAASSISSAQSSPPEDGVVIQKRDAAIPDTQRAASVNAMYFDPLQGVSSSDLVRMVLASNIDLAAARLDIERARGRLRQAGLRPNPTFDFEQSSGRFTNSPGDRETSVGFALPLEVGGQRQRRIDLARVQLEAAEAEIADRERRLAAEVRAAHLEALALLMELEITGQFNSNDAQTARIVEARVTEGESAPLELNLVRVEVDRLRSRRSLIEGRLEGALLRLKSLTGISLEEPLRLRETLTQAVLPEPPASMEDAADIALRSRPDARLARLNERVAEAGLRLAQAEGKPDVIVSARYSFDRSIIDLPEPLVSFPDPSRRLSFGVSFELPIARRNQGATAEATVIVSQARRRREFTEQLVRHEVASAYKRYDASRIALATFERGVLGASALNIRTIREAYRLGAFRVTDVLTEERRLIDSQQQYIELLTERHRALIDLHSALASPMPLQ
ncbi:MAG TPA: TolC family protein [Blastocatellia bacterium]|nr:TolC family protein [Blastocatellia bacterium]